MTRPNLNALGLAEGHRETLVKFGATDVSLGFVGAQLKAALNELPRAEVTLNPGMLGVGPDYFATMSVEMIHGGTSYPRFVGTVVTAEPLGDEVTIKALSAVEMSERLSGSFVAIGMPSFELVYTLGRDGGMEEEQVNIPELDSLPTEVFEVVIPLSGVSVDEPVSLDGVDLLPASVADRFNARLELDDYLRVEYEAAAYALTLVTTSRMRFAEEEGIKKIEFAAAWLTAQLRYGLSTLPGGRVIHYDRKDSLARIVRKQVVGVRGLATRRQWLRRPGMLTQPWDVPLVPGGRKLEALCPNLTLQEKLSFVSLSQAAHNDDPLAQVRALFEAIEFYVQGITVPSIFTVDELHSLHQKVASDENLSEWQEQRLLEVIRMANDAPLKRRLMVAMQKDRVPMTKPELDHLWSLRKIRNDVVHGNSSVLPKRADVDYAVSLVARMLLFRAARRRVGS